MRPHWRLTITRTALLTIVTGYTEFQESSEGPQITRAVNAALATDTMPPLSQVAVSTHRGLVIRMGWRNDATVVRVRGLTRSVPGVRGVADEMTVPEHRP